MVGLFLLPLGVSAIVTAVGLALRSSSEYGAYAPGLVAVGSAGAACVGAMIVARAFGLGIARHQSQDAAALKVLADELVVAAESVERRGLLALAESRVSVWGDLYEAGTKKAIEGVASERIRDSVNAEFVARSARAKGSARKAVLMAQVFGVMALLVALSVVGASLLTDTIAGFSDGTALGVMLLVYGSFMLTVIAQDLAGRTQRGGHQHELASAMIGEALALIRMNSSAGVIRASMQRMLEPGETPVSREVGQERRAA